MYTTFNKETLTELIERQIIGETSPAREELTNMLLEGTSFEYIAEWKVIPALVEENLLKYRRWMLALLDKAGSAAEYQELLKDWYESEVDGTVFRASTWQHNSTNEMSSVAGRAKMEALMKLKSGMEMFAIIVETMVKSEAKVASEA